jgi:hypothetical protein
VSLFVRIFSQALQAFMPIALSLTWFERTGRNRVASAIRRGLLISIPATMVASWLFHRTSHAALDEAVLAAMTVAATVLFARRVHLAGWIVTTLAALIVVRQTMEIGSALETAALEVRLFDPTAAIAAGLVVGAGVAWAMRRLSTWLARRELVSATRAFTLMFFVQAAIYTFHELAEARLLPASDLLHAATEAYGPDGIYGVHLSDLLVVAPLLAAAMTFARSRKKFGRRVQFAAPRPLRVRWLGAACLVFIGLQGAESSPHVYNSTVDRAAIIAIVRQPHLLFRDMTRSAAAGTVARAGTLSVASLGAPDGPRASTELSCERVSFAGGHGLCLHTEPGIFPRYTAAVLDGSLHPFASIKLEGRPSRTRTSADGRIGAITVFVFGENYAAPFSTRTTLVDMSSGDVIGELEQFSTWRDGMRWRAVDFNFWGVTFASDPNTFYATLRTGGSTYLVRGDLGLRRLTVLRDNVECPSISPDNRRLAFKKRVGPGLSDWRLAVLDLKTMTDRLIAAETRRIDDQVEWLDATHVLYSVPGGTTSLADVWVAPIDGDTPARVFLPGAESPIVVR